MSKSARLSGGRPGIEILMVGDFTCRGEMAYRIAREIKFFAGSGLSVGLLQARRPDPDKRINPEINAAVRRGVASVIDPAHIPECGTLIIHQPSIHIQLINNPFLVNCSEVVLICQSSRDIAAALQWKSAFSRNGSTTIGRIKIYSTAPLPPGHGAQVETRPWTPAISATTPIRRLRDGKSVLVGWIGDNAKQTSTGVTLQHRSGEGAEIHVIGDAGPTRSVLNDMSLDRLLAGVDLFVIGPEHSAALPDTIIAHALTHGTAVLMPTRLQPMYGRGPHYYDTGAFHDVLDSVVDALGAAAIPGGASSTIQATFVQTCRSGPITRLKQRRHVIGKPAPRTNKRPVLFLPSNGVGIGHLTRLLAIARKMDRRAVFASQAPAIEVLQTFGYPAEYLPSHAAVGGDHKAWDAWFGAQIEQIADRYDPALVVYDGNHPSDGLLRAVGSRSDCRLAWIRRGMWARTTSPFLKNARWCDVVIEPGELAGERDEGVTRQLRHEAQQVSPIRLLEPGELLDRPAAAAALGLNPNLPACLVQLGSGYNRDLLALLDIIIRELGKYPNLQIAIAEWVTGSVPLNLWPNVTILRGFPNSQFFRSFDFCISAAGYNSFHELIGYGVPTIFVANQHPSMDDQYGRAKFAQDSSAAFEISEDEIGELPDLIAMLMQAQARAFLVSQCGALARPNGATEAAAILNDLAERE